MQQLRSAIHNAITRFLKNQPPARIIAVGFALLILLGAVTLLSLWVERPEPTARYTEEAITIG